MCYQNVFAKKCGIKFLSNSYAFQNINVSDNNNSGGSGQQSVSVNNEHRVANVDNNNGWDSWHALWDYETVGSQHAISILYKYKTYFLTKKK